MSSASPVKEQQLFSFTIGTTSLQAKSGTSIQHLTQIEERTHEIGIQLHKTGQDEQSTPSPKKPTLNIKVENLSPKLPVQLLDENNQPDTFLLDQVQASIHALKNQDSVTSPGSSTSDRPSQSKNTLLDDTSSPNIFKNWADFSKTRRHSLFSINSVTILSSVIALAGDSEQPTPTKAIGINILLKNLSSELREQIYETIQKESEDTSIEKNRTWAEEHIADDPKLLLDTLLYVLPLNFKAEATKSPYSPTRITTEPKPHELSFNPISSSFEKFIYTANYDDISPVELMILINHIASSLEFDREPKSEMICHILKNKITEAQEGEIVDKILTRSLNSTPNKDANWAITHIADDPSLLSQILLEVLPLDFSNNTEQSLATNSPRSSQKTPSPISSQKMDFIILSTRPISPQKMFFNILSICTDEKRSLKEKADEICSLINTLSVEFSFEIYKQMLEKFNFSDKDSNLYDAMAHIADDSALLLSVLMDVLPIAYENIPSSPLTSIHSTTSPTGNQLNFDIFASDEDENTVINPNLIFKIISIGLNSQNDPSEKALIMNNLIETLTPDLRDKVYIQILEKTKDPTKIDNKDWALKHIADDVPLLLGILMDVIPLDITNL